MWYPVSTAPFDRDLELAVINDAGVHAVAFPCRRVLGGWIKAESKRWIDLRPTHWREWTTKCCFRDADYQTLIPPKRPRNAKPSI
jgi:hypothetical protein